MNSGVTLANWSKLWGIQASNFSPLIESVPSRPFREQ
jgi:hypothetical protein